jgi:hypothetical protein
MGYQTIDVRQSTPTIGAEILGIDLSGPLATKIIATLSPIIRVVRAHAAALAIPRLNSCPRSCAGAGHLPQLLTARAV